MLVMGEVVAPNRMPGIERTRRFTTSLGRYKKRALPSKKLMVMRVTP